MTPGPKDIKEYFKVELSRIKADVELTFNVFIYFSKSNHLITWRKVGDFPPQTLLDKYTANGLKIVWVHRSERDAYLRYINPPEEVVVQPVDLAAISEATGGASIIPSPPQKEAEPEAPASEPLAPLQVSSPFESEISGIPSLQKDDAEQDSAAIDAFGEAIKELRNSAGEEVSAVPFLNAESQALTQALESKIDDQKRSKAVAHVAQQLLRKAAAPKTPHAQKAADYDLRSTVRDVLERVAKHNKSVAAEIWALSEKDTSLDHGVNVATYAALLAMAFGRINTELLGEIALAGLLHDIGLCVAGLDEIPTKLRDAHASQAKGYANHIESSMAFIRSSPLAGQAERVLNMIRQHHEKFDGSGFPQGLEGFKIDDLAQLLSMADLLEELSNGEWDGLKRTRRQSLEEIERLDKTRTFPQFFNPELLSSVLKWLHNEDSQDGVALATEVADAKLKSLLKSA